MTSTGSASAASLHQALIAIAPAAAVTLAAGFFGLITWPPALAILAALAVVPLALRWPPAGRIAPPPAAAAPGTPATPAAAELVERLPDPVILLDARRAVVACNRPARETLGIGPLGGDLALSLRHPDILAAADAILAGAPPLSEEVTLPSPVMRTFTLYAAGLPAAATGATAATLPRGLLLLRDETQAKRAEQSRVDFVANATHELRSPLAAIIGFIETLRGPAFDDDDARKRFLALMQGEAERMARLIDDLMSLSRVEINEHVPPRVAVDLRTVVLGVASTLAVRAEAKAMTIEVACPEWLPEVRGDRDQLTQVFHNLVDNAVKYGRAATPIRIDLTLRPRLPGSGRPGVAVAVADQGDGIPPIHLPRLTERFYRADQGRSRRLGGTGLGLAIVKHIVNRHRGHLTIESRMGHGSRFTVYLPQVPGPRRAAGPPPDDREPPPAPVDVTKV